MRKWEKGKHVETEYKWSFILGVEMWKKKYVPRQKGGKVSWITWDIFRYKNVCNSHTKPGKYIHQKKKKIWFLYYQSKQQREDLPDRKSRTLQISCTYFTLFCQKLP